MIAKPARRGRRGMSVVAVLVCLVIITLVSGAVLKVGLAHREVVRGQEHRVQCAWLAESGLQRALARLDAEGDYKGETWSLGGAELGQAGPAGLSSAPGEPGAAAVITVAVEPAGEGGSRRRIHVQADYPRDGPGHVRQSRDVLIDLETNRPGVK